VSSSNDRGQIGIQRTQDVKTYFTDRARLFDALYEGDSRLDRVLNRVLRRPMFQRYVFTLAAIGHLSGRRILDVGCGAGRYAVELCQAGADVVGIDFSSEMLAMARQRAERARVGHKATFIAEDFVQWSREESAHFDVAFAMGVLDYVENAQEFIAQMAKVADEVIVSFPRPTPVRMPLRKLRYWLRGCPVHFYRKREIEQMYTRAGLRNVTIRRLGLAGFWADGRR
jgi:2-polyprenyl-3-methyl-5-hydroxy-6-metoxy-1,4-benzoquinol methylase